MGAFAQSAALVGGSEDETAYAIKVFNKKVFSESETLSSYILTERNVACFINEINCPFLEKALFAGQTRNHLLLKYEMSKGGDLDFRLDTDNNLSRDEIRYNMACLALAIAELHKYKIVHRTIHTRNIALTSSGIVKLSGFEHCCVDDGHEKRGTYGVLQYMAPEMVFDTGHLRPCDVWSFGVVLYELIAGNPPYLGNTIDEMKDAFNHTPAYPPEIFTDREVSLLRRCLSTSVSDRFTMEDVIKHSFFRSIDWDLMRAGKLDPPRIPTQYNFSVLYELDHASTDLSNEEDLVLQDAQIDRFYLWNYGQDCSKELETLQNPLMLEHMGLTLLSDGVEQVVHSLWDIPEGRMLVTATDKAIFRKGDELQYDGQTYQILKPPERTSRQLGYLRLRPVACDSEKKEKMRARMINSQNILSSKDYAELLQELRFDARQIVSSSETAPEEEDEAAGGKQGAGAHSKENGQLREGAGSADTLGKAGGEGSGEDGKVVGKAEGGERDGAVGEADSGPAKGV